MSAAEFARCGRLRQVDLDWFRERDVSGFRLLGYRADPTAIGWAAFDLASRQTPDAPLYTPGFEVRRARVLFQRGQRFRFAWEREADDGSEPAFILPVIEGGALIDLVAWHPRSGRLATLWRRAGMLIGPDGLDEEGPVLVHRDPLAWLRAGRRGVVIVHEALARPALLEADALLTEDVEQGVELEAMLRKVRLPCIMVPAPEAERAAA